jgi:septum formation protein
MELIEKVKDFRFILASQSPRRQDIFRSLGLEYEIRTKEVEESFPSSLNAGEIATYLAEKKSKAQRKELTPLFG